MSKGIIYNSALLDIATGAIDFATDEFYVLLAGSDYRPDKQLDTKRSDVKGEIFGIGYDAGGKPASVRVSLDNANDRLEIFLGAALWPASTIKAQQAVYYRRSGKASEDALIACIDFGGSIVSTIGEFSLTQSTLRIRNDIS